MASKSQHSKSLAPIKKSTTAAKPPVSKDAVVLATIALTHKLLDEANEQKAEKKKKYLSKLKLSTEEERRSAIENGKIKFVHQELRKSNLKKIVANNCVIVGDNNNVIGNDNVLIGLNNKATGDNNKIVTPGTTTVVARSGPEPQSTAATAAAVTSTAVAAVVPPSSYYNEEYLTLPDNWIQMNGVIIYREEDINTVLKWILRDWSFTSHGRTVPAYAEGAEMARNFSIAETVYAFLPPAVLEIASRYGIPPKENGVASAQLRGHALAYGKILMPHDMPPSTRAPKKQEHIITMPYFSRGGTTSTPAVAAAIPQTSAPPTTTTPTPSPASSSSTSKKPNFLPSAGVNSENSNWKCSLLDLPGAADIAGAEEPTCKICLVNRMDVLVEPCHHLAMCRDCAKELVKINPERQNCPVCRNKIEYGTILFFD